MKKKNIHVVNMFLLTKKNHIFRKIRDDFYQWNEKKMQKLTAACQTKAKRKKSKGITGIISTIGFKKA